MCSRINNLITSMKKISILYRKSKAKIMKKINESENISGSATLAQ